MYTVYYATNKDATGFTPTVDEDVIENLTLEQAIAIIRFIENSRIPYKHIELHKSNEDNE